jgi:hypothetical protein
LPKIPKFANPIWKPHASKQVKHSQKALTTYSGKFLVDPVDNIEITLAETITKLS